jgi:hypothetical protein
MILEMKNEGSCRKTFALSGPPPSLFKAKSGSSGSEVPIFQPYDEDLPLQSGYYTFVIDSKGHFRVKFGNSSSHASFVDRQDVASAGSFRIGRMGKLAEVFCSSYNYRTWYRDHRHQAVVYTVESFVRNPAFDASAHVVFRFSRGVGNSFVLDYDGNPISEEVRQQKLELLDAEGCESIRYTEFTREQVASFIKYKPPTPPRLYGVHIDQSVTALEEDGDIQVTPGSSPTHHFSIDNPVIPTGKPNFVIDKDGWLILGMKHHHLLSGGGHVGGAGHLLIDASGQVEEMQLNFSGHYRPQLSSEYVRYVYRTIRHHPLVTTNPNCKITGRTFNEETYETFRIGFEASELEVDDLALDEYLEVAVL